MFPEFDNGPVLASLFTVFDSACTQDNMISFEEYVRVLSVLSRGSIEEKATRMPPFCNCLNQ